MRPKCSALFSKKRPAKRCMDGQKVSGDNKVRYLHSAWLRRQDSICMFFHKRKIKLQLLLFLGNCLRFTVSKSSPLNNLNASR